MQNVNYNVPARTYSTSQSYNSSGAGSSSASTINNQPTSRTSSTCTYAAVAPTRSSGQMDYSTPNTYGWESRINELGEAMRMIAGNVFDTTPYIEAMYFDVMYSPNPEMALLQGFNAFLAACADCGVFSIDQSLSEQKNQQYEDSIIPGFLSNTSNVWTAADFLAASRMPLSANILGNLGFGMFGIGFGAAELNAGIKNGNTNQVINGALTLTTSAGSVYATMAAGAGATGAGIVFAGSLGPVVLGGTIATGAGMYAAEKQYQIYGGDNERYLRDMQLWNSMVY